MAKALWYTDPHQGADLKANTTSLSRQKLRDAQHDSLVKVICDFRRENPEGHVGCAGDFFDTDSNSEAVIMKALKVASVTDLILGGNHDVKNTRDTACSLDVVTAVWGDRVVGVDFGEVKVVTTQLPKSNIVYYMVPHHTNQEIFDAALVEATRRRVEEQDPSGDTVHYLVLHCNYDSGFAVQDTALNLGAPQAKKLLESFDYILIGHDHHHKTAFDDRVIVIGNTFPINFGDISEKFALNIGEDGHPESITTIWDPAHHYLELDASGVSEGLTPVSNAIQFLKITGEIDASQLYDVTKAIAKLWKTLPNVLAIKPEFKVKTASGTVQADTAISQLTLTEMIQSELAEQPTMLKLFEDLLKGVQS